MTNYDKIKNMTIKEMATFFKDKACIGVMKQYQLTCSKFNNCRECWLDYLKQEADE